MRWICIALALLFVSVAVVELSAGVYNHCILTEFGVPLGVFRLEVVAVSGTHSKLHHSVKFVLTCYLLAHKNKFYIA